MTIEERREKNRIKNKAWREKDRERYNKFMREWKASNPDKTARYKLKARYNISATDYERLHQKQNGLCAICGNKEKARHNRSKEVLKLAVDHCHKTGKVRGLLCQDCNRGIAKFNEDPIRISNAINYITYHKNT